MLGAVLCLVLGGCSFFWEDIQQQPDPAPFLATSADDIRKAADSEKVAAPLEVAGPIAANSISVAPWIVCLRSGATEQSRQRVYSVFFREGKVSSIQASAIVDRCEAQHYVPLPASAAPVQAVASKSSRSNRP
jgi:hypothetical protein